MRYSANANVKFKAKLSEMFGIPPYACLEQAHFQNTGRFLTFSYSQFCTLEPQKLEYSIQNSRHAYIFFFFFICQTILYQHNAVRNSAGVCREPCPIAIFHSSKISCRKRVFSNTL
ncbi:hypothetical protein CEXT_322221 [Caerostris extrusa]|uniref:Uncharacterized protein n=1 Tax=Caerostris extrusa TaxID=172846 RepID=A0AAV4MXF6_CAEEX|nr:hypothetical protein CEXT_322221 [Caerostris extrusa]